MKKYFIIAILLSSFGIVKSYNFYVDNQTNDFIRLTLTAAGFYAEELIKTTESVVVGINCIRTIEATRFTGPKIRQKVKLDIPFLANRCRGRSMKIRDQNGSLVIDLSP